MSYTIIFNPHATNADENGANFFGEPYRDFCLYLGRCASDSGNQYMADVSKWASKDRYLDTTWMDVSQLTLMRTAAQAMLNDPDLAPWERTIRGLYAHYDQPLDDHSAIMRKATDYGLTLVIRKMDEMIAAKVG